MPHDADPRPQSVSFDPVAHLYDETRGYPPGVVAAIADAMLRHGPLATGAHTLEIGVGTGRIALPLLERGIDLTGVDLAPRMVERLRAKYDDARASQPGAPWGRLDITLGDVTALPFADGSFDAVVAVHVLHLVAQWRRALDEALRVLRPGAPLLLGQDVIHGASDAHPLQDEWAEIVRSLGVNPQRVGVGSFREILEEARGRGLRVEEWLVADWTMTHTPAGDFAYVAERVWSLTWRVPDDLFAESVRRLERWAHARYGDRWRTPSETTYSFKLARVSTQG